MPGGSKTSIEPKQGVSPVRNIATKANVDILREKQSGSNRPDKNSVSIVTICRAKINYNLNSLEICEPSVT